MSIFGGMRSAVTGLSAQSQALGIIADNISNVNTVGYKESQPQFSTLVTVQATKSQHSPGGVTTNVLRGIEQQGLLEASTSPTDLAVSGNGFFVVNENDTGTGDILFTRAGSFRPDKDGNLVNTAGFFLTGWPITGGVVQQTNVLSAMSVLNVGNLFAIPQATSNVSIGANLSASAQPTDTFDLAVQVFDQQGGPRNLTLTFTRTATPNQWTLDGSVQNALFPNGATTGTLGTVTFNADGTLGTVAANAANATLNGDDLVVIMDYDSNLATVADQVPVTFDLGTLGVVDGLTQFAGASVPNFVNQDGRQFGSFNSVSVGEDGRVTVLFDNGSSREVYQIPLVTFNNPNGLTERSGNVFIETGASGTPTAHAPSTGGAGIIAPSALEASTVDIADEFTRMIITQRAFSANTRVITTGDEMLDELVRIVR
ncbi:MAG: flagellar hook protein FlgE [Alphaproteobacteria bacterium]|nr:flagellar hook protein FlgE [Alphaproteobacteria bacterium]